MAEPKLSTEQQQFDPSERARIRQVVNMVVGNGEPGLSSRIRRLEWIGGLILAGITGVLIQGMLLLIQQMKG